MSSVSIEERYSAYVEDDRVNSRVYTDPEIFADEMTKIWERGWVYVGHDSEVAEPGDFVTRRIGRQPIIMVRGADGEVRLLLNRCPHRGNTMCQEESGSGSYFRCAYHAWTFNTDGALRAIPFSSGYGPEFDSAALAMSRVPRIAIYRGFVFGSLAVDGPDLAEHLGRSAQYIDRMVDLAPEGRIDLRAGALKTRVHGNWKMVYENVTDGYHPPFLHRSVFADSRSEGLVIGDAYGDNSLITTRDLGRGHTMLDFTATNRVTGGLVFNLGGAVSAGANDEYRQTLARRLGVEKAAALLADGMSNIGIFPNLGLLFQDLRVIEPVSVNETIIYNYPALLVGAPKEINRARLLQEIRSYGPAGCVGPDDHEIYERNQAAFEARLNEWVLLRRGLHRETRTDDGTIVGSASDETTMRGFWHHYRSVMTGV